MKVKAQVRITLQLCTMGKFSYMHITYKPDFPKMNLLSSYNSLPKLFFLASSREGVSAISLISYKGTGLVRFIGNSRL